MGLLRPPHIIKANKNCEYPTRVIFFDTETKPTLIDGDTLNHTLKLGDACYYIDRSDLGSPVEEWNNFVSHIDFWAWALSKVTDHRRLILMAHNLDFDFLVLHGLSELKEWGWHAKKMIMGNRLSIWTFVQYKYKPDSKQWDNYVKRYGKRPRVVKTIVLLDMMNYFKMSLASLGEAMGFPKMEIDFNTCTDEELAVYCHNDVYIMLQAWKKWLTFLKENDLGVWGQTLPGQAFNAYRHRFMPHKISVHSHEKCLALERAGYFGGRCECFRIGHYKDGPYYLFDVNSMYPYVMRNHPYPTKMVSYVSQASVSDVAKWARQKCVIATVYLETTSAAYPRRYNQRLTFPVGHFWTTLTTPELIHALKHDRILAVKDIAIYDCEFIFKEYVDFFWTQRKHFKKVGNKAYDKLCKLFLNSLYGKFGQYIDEYQEFMDDPGHGLACWKDWDVDEQRWLKFKQMGGKISVAMGKLEAYNSFPAIAAHVTAYARQELFKHILRAGLLHIYYCDTDSIIVDTRGSMGVFNSIHDTALGALTLEKKSDTITINNAKDYIFADKRKLKGVTQKAKEIHPNVFGQYQQVSLKSVLWNNYDDNCFWKWVEKHLRDEYNKGVVLDGGLVIPYHLNEKL